MLLAVFMERRLIAPRIYSPARTPCLYSAAFATSPAFPTYACAQRIYGPGDFSFDGKFTFDDDSLGRRANRFRFDRRQLDSLARNMKRFEYDFNREFAPLADRLSRVQGLNGLGDRLIAPFETWSRNGSATQPSTIRGLDAYPSNPDKNMLNVRFTAPGKGDALIVVTNPKGKEVARRELKDFTGEFVGQVDLGRKAEGVFFVTVTQNEDGAVRRVVLKKDDVQTK